MRPWIVRALEALDRDESVGVVTVVSTRGSTPSRTSSSLVRFEDGRFVGTVGGGALEAEALRVASTLAAASAPFVREYRLDRRGELDLVCGGLERLRYERVEPRSSAHDALRAAVTAHAARRPGWLVLDATLDERVDALRFVPEGYRDPDDLVFAVREACPRRAGTLDVGGRPRFVEPILEDGRLHVVGAGHVGREVAALAASCEFEVFLYDDRPEWLDGAEVPDDVTKVALAAIEADLASRLEPADRVVSVHRSHRGDEAVVAAALTASASYVGMIGSLAKRHAVFERLASRGFAEAALARVHSPIGLPIRARSPREIAVSIVAELIAHRHRPEQDA